MYNVIIFFDNIVESAPKAISCINGTISVHYNIDNIKYPSKFYSLGYGDALESIINLGKKHQIRHRRIELLYKLNLKVSKSEAPKKWNCQKTNFLRFEIQNKDLLKAISGYERGKLNWDDIKDKVYENKSLIISSTKSLIKKLESKFHQNNKSLAKWLVTEFRIDQHFLKKRYDGVGIDQERLESFLHKLNKERYQASLVLERDYGKDLPGQIKRRQQLIEAVLPEFSDIINEDSEAWKYLKENKNINVELQNVLVCIESTIQYGSLIKHYTGPNQTKIHMDYNTMGSASGRIFIENPGTQYLKKDYRSIFKPSNGQILVYFDYTSFEPGIAFALSEDKELIRLYNKGDIYSHFSKMIFGTQDFRQQIKNILLMKIYGMKNKNLFKIVDEPTGFSIDKVLEELNKYHEFNRWMFRSVMHARNKKYASSRFYKRDFTDTKDYKIMTSAVNHEVQSTGSAILKKAISKLINLKSISIILPMHDALLIELPIKEEATLVKEIIEIMEKCYLSVTESTISKVKIEEF